MTLSIQVSSGIQLAVEIFSQEKIPTVFFLHGGGENRRVWSPIAPSIEVLGWRTVAMDLRGHGDSGRALEYKIDDFINDVVAVIAHHCGQPVLIVGGSIGAILGAIVAGEGLAPVSGLVLLDTATRLPSMDGPRHEVQKIASAKARGVEAVAAVDPKFLDGTFLQDINRDSDRLRRAAQKLRVPVLLVSGQYSRYRSDAAEKAAREDIPHAEFESAPGGHLLARDCPAEVSKLIATFIRRHWPDHSRKELVGATTHSQ